MVDTWTWTGWWACDALDLFGYAGGLRDRCRSHLLTEGDLKDGLYLHVLFVQLSWYVVNCGGPDVLPVVFSTLPVSSGTVDWRGI